MSVISEMTDETITAPCESPTGELSRQARRRISRPLFHADWLDAVFLHYEVEPAALQSHVPFQLHLRDGKAYLSLVAFTLRRLRSDRFPRAGQWLFQPLSEHGFLNARTYVRAGSETGIYFLAEWLSKKLAVPLGRPLFGLPYHFGRFDCRHDPRSGRLTGNVAGAAGSLRYHAGLDTAPRLAPCRAGSLDEFLLERYTAFTQWRKLRRFFCVWHPPWPVAPLAATVEDASLLRQTGDWIDHARLIAAHYSPGVHDVWMGHPQILWQTS
jgi:uncharacterized protein YqjF (DUF2071 family)